MSQYSLPILNKNVIKVLICTYQWENFEASKDKWQSAISGQVDNIIFCLEIYLEIKKVK